MFADNNKWKCVENHHVSKRRCRKRVTKKKTSQFYSDLPFEKSEMGTTNGRREKSYSDWR